jgi:uncharacterized protein (TIGR00255 family)
MTGFGRGVFHHGKRSYRVELRTLNHRFLDIKFRLPWQDADLESRISQHLKRDLWRGRAEFSVWEDTASGSAGSLQLNEPVAEDVATILAKLTETLECDRLTAATLLPPIRELVNTSGLHQDTDALWSKLRLGLAEALDDLLTMRRTEGQSLESDLHGYLNELRQITERIGLEAKKEPTRIQARLADRVKSLLGGGEVDAQRLAQEVAILADKSDVSEELARLASHLDQTRELLAVDQPLGRKLEFLLQELNREVNTIAAKTSSVSVSQMVVEAKSLLERLREQIQNVE